MAFNLSKINPAELLKICNPDPNKAGKTLLAINALGMIFAALSNTYAAAVDKNTSAEDKKFLIPAGFATGVANIGLYYTLTTKIIDLLQGRESKNGKKAIDGLADKVLRQMSDNDIETNALKYANSEIKKAGKKASSIFNKGVFKKLPDNYKDIVENKLLNNGVPSEDAIKLFKSNFKSGFGVLGAFIGAVVGSAILTPIIRDVSAYFVQKHMEKKNPEMKDKPYKPYFEPTRIESVRYGNKPLTLKNYMAFTHGGNLKV